MAFKMKGSSLYGKLNLNRGGNENRPDGRAKSSAFQLTEDEIKWGEEKKTSTDVTETPTSTDTTTNYETKGVSKGKKVEKFATTPEEIAKWEAAPEENKVKYRDKDVSKKRSESSSVPKEKPKEDPPKEVKMCHCKGYAQHTPGQGGSVSYKSYEKYPCDGPKHPNCTKPSKLKQAKQGGGHSSDTRPGRGTR